MLPLLSQSFFMKYSFIVSTVVGTILLAACSGQVSQHPSTNTPSSTPKAQVAEGSYRAGTIQTYSSAAYAQALADGKDVIIDFHASWCDICVKNAPGIRAAFESTNNTNVIGFIADYDKETALENQFGVSSQSTLVKVRGSDPTSAKKVGTIGPGPITQQQMELFIQS